MNITPNYKNKKYYSTAKYPIRQPLIIMWLIWLLCKIALLGKKYKVEKINMEGLKPPYMLLSNHMYFIDFMLCAQGTFPPSLAYGADWFDWYQKVYFRYPFDKVH